MIESLTGSAMPGAVDGYRAARRFLADHSEEHWRLVLRACLAVAEARGEFAGAWVQDEAKKMGGSWFPNLRPLAASGVLRKTEASRGGRRAYYVMLDPEGVKKALQEAEIA